MDTLSVLSVVQALFVVDREAECPRISFCVRDPQQLVAAQSALVNMD